MITLCDHWVRMLLQNITAMDRLCAKPATPALVAVWQMQIQHNPYNIAGVAKMGSGVATIFGPLRGSYSDVAHLFRLRRFPDCCRQWKKPLL